MASFKHFPVAFLALSLVIVSHHHHVSGQPSRMFSSTEKMEHMQYPIEDGQSLFVGRPRLANCPLPDEILDLHREGNEDAAKVPLLRFDSPRFLDDRFYVPRFRSKKAQKAIHVGDYVVKGNGQTIADNGALRSPAGVGGSLRSSGK